MPIDAGKYTRDLHTFANNLSHEQAAHIGKKHGRIYILFDEKKGGWTIKECGLRQRFLRWLLKGYLKETHHDYIAKAILTAEQKDVAGAKTLNIYDAINRIRKEQLGEGHRSPSGQAPPTQQQRTSQETKEVADIEDALNKISSETAQQFLRDTPRESILESLLQLQDTEMMKELAPHLLDWKDQKGRNLLHYAFNPQACNSSLTVPPNIQLAKILMEKKEDLLFDTNNDQIIPSLVYGLIEPSVSAQLDEKMKESCLDHEGKYDSHFVAEILDKNDFDLTQSLLKSIDFSKQNAPSLYDIDLSKLEKPIINALLQKISSDTQGQYTPECFAKVLVHGALESIHYMLRSIDFNSQKSIFKEVNFSKLTNPEIIKVLLEKIPDDWQDNDGNNILHFVCAGGDTNWQLADVIIEDKPHLVNQPDNDGTPPLSQTYLDDDIIKKDKKYIISVINKMKHYSSRFFDTIWRTKDLDLIKPMMETVDFNQQRDIFADFGFGFLSIKSDDSIDLLIGKIPKGWKNDQGNSLAHLLLAQPSVNENLLNRLLEQQPEVLFETDNQGKTFVHAFFSSQDVIRKAARSKEGSLLYRIIEQYPEVLAYQDNDGRYLFEDYFETMSKQVAMVPGAEKLEEFLITKMDAEAKKALHKRLAEGGNLTREQQRLLDKLSA